MKFSRHSDKKNDYFTRERSEPFTGIWVTVRWAEWLAFLLVGVLVVVQVFRLF